MTTLTLDHGMSLTPTMNKVHPSFIIPGRTVMAILYSCSGVGVSHGLGLGLGFSHIVELWFFAFAGS